MDVGRDNLGNFYDGTITPADVVLALKLAVTGEYDPIGDVNDDHQISSLDALTILQAAAVGGN
ncbi:MAG: hypothetical protein EF812_04030 [Methanosarcinales archaeon]|nr:MAG: hypothetical protein EF812_04030 [Methanosarcinales archaeon]